MDAKVCEARNRGIHFFRGFVVFLEFFPFYLLLMLLFICSTRTSFEKHGCQLELGGNGGRVGMSFAKRISTGWVGGTIHFHSNTFIWHNFDSSERAHLVSPCLPISSWPIIRPYQILQLLHSFICSACLLSIWVMKHQMRYFLRFS